MKVRDWMTSSLVTVTPETGISEARTLMHQRGIRHLLVMDGPRLLGILTDRDIRLALPSPATSLSAWEIDYLLIRLRVEEVMKRAVIVIGPERPVRDAVTLMLKHTIGALPVADGGRVVGIITETDLLRAFDRMLGEPHEPAAVALRT